MNRHRRAIWAAVALGALVLASCGSDDDDDTSATTAAATASDDTAADATTAETDAPAATTAPDATVSEGTSAGATPTRGVTDTTIKVGGVQVVNGQGYSYENMCKGAEVVFDKVNATGGINGRTIDWVGCRDDGGVSDTDTAETQRLIEQDEVFAIVPASIIFTGSEIAQQANVPYFGWGISPYFCNNEQGFGFNGCTGPTDPEWTNSTWAKLAKTVVPDAKTVGHISLDIPPGKVNAAATKRGYEAEGLELVYDDGSLPLTGVADFTPYVQKILEANPDVMVIQIQTPIPLISALRAAGYEGATFDAVSYGPTYLEDEAAAQALEGSYILTSVTPFESTDVPGIKQLLEDVQTYGDADQVVNDQFAMGYFSAMMFVDMATKAGPDLTYESFYDVANHGDYCFNGDGALGDICYPAGHANQSGCLALVQVVDGAYVPREPMTCTTGIGNNGGVPGS
ncbi:MAG: ABC transporter substrate-binding protein [Ilumatobacteraceae bacterium]